jgi:hypothetical protein
VPVAAVVAGVGNDFPRWFNAGIEGWVTAFLATTFFLLRLWGQDPEFRKEDQGSPFITKLGKRLRGR